MSHSHPGLLVRRDPGQEHTPADSLDALEPLSPELVAALAEPQRAPGREFLRLLRADGLLAPTALMAPWLWRLAASSSRWCCFVGCFRWELRKYAREQYNPTTTIFATSTLAGTSMVTVSTKDEYVEILKAFGELQDALDLALKRYAIERIVTKVDELRQRDALYQAKYGQDYPTFAQRIATDETFVRHVETQVNKLWEVDLADWEFCYKGLQDWMKKLETVLLA